MKRRHHYGAVAALCVGFCLSATVLFGQESVRLPQAGDPQDWSQRQIVFSRNALLQHPEVIYQEPRVLHQAIQRWRGRYANVVPGVELTGTPSVQSSQQDWNVAIRGRLSPNMYPAKFTFDPAATPSCQNDYVVFGTTAAGVTGGASNLVAFNNLYSGTGGFCGAAPTVMFAYNTTTVAGGHIVTSPVLSELGDKIAFVESLPGNTIFHVLTWTAGQGAIANAAAPNMTTLVISNTANCTTSSPWLDYVGDVAYLGTDDGKLYKITGVFHGTPALAGPPWPILVSNNLHLTPPVLDSHLGLLMVGSTNGNLYQINANTGVTTSFLSIGAGPNHGILAAPIVDITNGTTFVISSDDNTSGVLVQVDTATNTLLAKGRIGIASKSGTAVNLYQAALSDSYYTDPSTGVIRTCGTGAADTSPWQYAFGFTGRLMKTAPVFSKQLVTSTAARCNTGWTEFFNPNIGVGGTDFFFFGLNQDCTAPGNGTADGCVVARTSDTVLLKATIASGPSGIVIDNYANPALFGQASSIYMTARGVNTAYKFTQLLVP